MKNVKKFSVILLFVLLILAILGLFPWLFQQVVHWQREFNQILSENLHQIKQNSISAGLSLIAVSFLYGVIHALGPGHGKFIITSYLSTHKTLLGASMRLTFLSSLMQAVVAVSATTLIVVLLNLSSAYFKLSQLWLERIAYGLILWLGFQWIWQSGGQIWKSFRVQKLSIKSIRTSPDISVTPLKAGKTGGQKLQSFSMHSIHQHSENCACGHQHLPSAKQLAQMNGLKSQLMIILSIGMRPCTGAIFILFLSYMLDLYLWGILATFAMAIGTGLTLSGFALLVQYARQTAQKIGSWYFSPFLKQHFNPLLKIIFGVLLIVFASALLYSTSLSSVGGAVLFGR